MMKSVNYNQQIPRERKSTFMLKSLRDFPEFSVYDEPVRKAGTTRDISLRRILGKSQNFQRIHTKDKIDPTASTNLHRKQTIEDDHSPFQGRFSDIKMTPLTTSVNVAENNNNARYKKKNTYTLQAIPTAQQLTERTEIRRRYK